MHVLTSPIQYIKLLRALKKQKRTALHMLVLSGVVRPSCVELRYSTPIASITAFRRQLIVTELSQTHPISLPSSGNNATLNVTQTGQWTHSLSASVLPTLKATAKPWTDADRLRAILARAFATFMRATAGPPALPTAETPATGHVDCRF